MAKDNRSEYWQRAKQYSKHFQVPVQQVRQEAGFKQFYRDMKSLSSKVQRGHAGTEKQYRDLKDMYDAIGLDIDEEFHEEGDTP